MTAQLKLEPEEEKEASDGEKGKHKGGVGLKQKPNTAMSGYNSWTKY